VLALAAPDLAVMALYGVVVLGIGWLANRRQRDTDDYFLGGRRLRWWVVGISLIATSFSSVSLIGGTGYGAQVGMRWLQLQIGDLIALAVVCVVFLPFFSGLGFTTAYEYLERRFGGTARTVASGLFIAQTLLRASILVYSPALALSALTGWRVEVAIVVSAAAAVVYSAFGGISAVVWTDLIQMCVIVGGVLWCLFLAVGDVPGGWGAVMDHAQAGHSLATVTTGGVPITQMNLVGALVPYLVLALSLFGTGQQAVQRFLSCRDLGAARRAAMTGWVAGTVTLGLTLFLGVVLGAWLALAPAAHGLTAKTGDAILPLFIGSRLPPGLEGLMLAAIFAASMSSLDSAVHSISTAVIVDFQRRFSRRGRDVRAELRLARVVTASVGVLATVGALYAAERTSLILETLITWLGYFAGPLLGIFLLGMLTRGATEAGALAGVGAAFAGIVALLQFTDGPRSFGFHPLWIAPASLAVTLAVGLVVSAIPWPHVSRVREPA